MSHEAIVFFLMSAFFGLILFLYVYLSNRKYDIREYIWLQEGNYGKRAAWFLPYLMFEIINLFVMFAIFLIALTLIVELYEYFKK